LARTLTIGLSGLGSIGRRHARLLAGRADVRLLVYDTSPPDDLPEAECVPSFERLLQSGVDAVVVASPDEAHLDQAGAACRAGVPVLVEKPLAASLDAGRELVAIAGESKAPVLVGYVLRHTAALRRVGELLEAEVVGPIASVHALLGAYETLIAARNRFANAVPYRLVYDYSHEWDYLAWLCGPIRSVAASGRRLPDPEFAEDPNVLDGVLGFVSGVAGTFHLDYVQRRSTRELTVVGERGRLRADLRSGAIRLALDDDTERVEELAEPRDASFERQLEHFLAVVRGEEQPLVTASDGLRALAVAEAVRAAAESGTWVTVAD
jgi:predicted dehydrogenase